MSTAGDLIHVISSRSEKCPLQPRARTFNNLCVCSPGFIRVFQIVLLVVPHSMCFWKISTLLLISALAVVFLTFNSQNLDGEIAKKTLLKTVNKQLLKKLHSPTGTLHFGFASIQMLVTTAGLPLQPRFPNPISTYRMPKNDKLRFRFSPAILLPHSLVGAYSKKRNLLFLPLSSDFTRWRQHVLLLTYSLIITIWYLSSTLFH